MVLPAELRQSLPLLLNPSYQAAETDVYRASELPFRRALERVAPDDPLIRELILKPTLVSTIPLYVDMPANGSEDELRGVVPTARVRHHVGARNTPTKGGIRIITVPNHLSRSGAFNFVTAAGIALSRTSLAKTCLIDFQGLGDQLGVSEPVVFGGGAKGIIGIPESIYTDARKTGRMVRLTEDLARRYGYYYGIEGIIDPLRDSVAPDMGTYGEEAMVALLDGYRQALVAKGSLMPDNVSRAVVTAKPEEAGGTASRAGALGYGAIVALRKVLESEGQDISGMRVVIDGSGNAAFHAARELEALGARVIGISDTNGQVYNPDGVDVAGLERHKGDKQPLSNYQSNGVFSGSAEKDDFLGAECDVLLLASGDHVITARNASKIRPSTGIVVEASNLGVTPLADVVLTLEGNRCIPGIVAGCGGLVASWIEYVGNITDRSYSLEDGQRMIEFAVGGATENMLDIADNRGTSLADAAHIMAATRAVALRRQYPVMEAL